MNTMTDQSPPEREKAGITREDARAKKGEGESERAKERKRSAREWEQNRDEKPRPKERDGRPRGEALARDSPDQERARRRLSSSAAFR